MGGGVSKKKRTPSEKSKETFRKKVVVLGIEGVGKTSLVQKLKYGQTKMVTPTIGFNMERYQNENLDLMMFDIAGGARSMWAHYMENADVIIYVVDATSEAQSEIQQELLKSLNRDHKLKNKLFICALNKADSEHAISNCDFLNSSKLIDMIDADVILIRTSSVSGEGISSLTNKISGYFTALKKS